MRRDLNAPTHTRELNLWICITLTSSKPWQAPLVRASLSSAPQLAPERYTVTSSPGLLRSQVLIRSGTPQERKYAERIAPVCLL